MPTNYFQKNRFLGIAFQNINPKCASCPLEDETNEHVFHKCVASNSLRDFVTNAIIILLPALNLYFSRLLVNDFPHGTSYGVVLMATAILQIYMYVIWNNRKKFNFRREIVHINEGKNTILKHFKSVMLLKYNKLVPHNSNKIKLKYCHTPESCDILENEGFHVDLFF